MRNHLCLKLFWSFLIGFAGVSATLSRAQAADIGAPVLEVRHGQTATSRSRVQMPAKSALETLRDSATPSKGVQGPIRTEDFSDQATQADSEMLRRDLLLERYPVSNNVAIP